MSLSYDNDLAGFDDDNTLHMTSGIAIAIDLTATVAVSAIRVAGDQRKWEEKRARIQTKLERTATILSQRWELYLSGPGGNWWWWKVDGTDCCWFTGGV